MPSVLVLLEEHISVMNKEDLGSFYNQLLTFFFTALSFRELHPQVAQQILHMQYTSGIVYTTPEHFIRPVYLNRVSHTVFLGLVEYFAKHLIVLQ